MRLFKILFIFGFLGLVLWGCGGGGGGGEKSFTPSGRIMAVAEKSGSNVTIKVGGTKGAAPSGSTIQVTDINTQVTQTTTAAADGSFDPTFTGSTSDVFRVVVSNNGVTITDTTIGVTIISQAVKRNLAHLGSFPTQIEIHGNRAYVVNGGSDNIQIFDLDQDPPKQIGTIVLPPGSDPVAITFLNNTQAYVANLTGQSVALVNVQTGQCEFLIVRSDHVPSNSSICQNQETVDTQFFEDPSGIAVANGRVYVTNSNLDAFFNPAGNGFITVIDAQTNRVISRIDTSGANSGSIKPIQDSLYVVNSGHVIFNQTTSAFSCDSKFPPSIDVINPQSGTIIHTIDIPLSPNNPSVCLPSVLEPTPDGKFGYIGLGLVGALLKVDLKNNILINGPSNPIVVTDLSGLDFTADIKIRADGLGFTTLFNTDQIAVIDTATDTINPFPFIAPFPSGLRADNPSSEIFDGVQSIDIRPGKPGTDFKGADIFFITGISQELGSINTALVLPPE